MKNLFILFAFVLFVLTIKGREQADKNRKLNIVRLDVKRKSIVDKEFTLYIPNSLKFGDELVNEKVQGVLNLYVNEEMFCYVRPKDVQRNEYIIDPTCGSAKKFIDVKPGDDIEVKFAKSNMPKAANVVLFGEEEVK